MAHRRLTGATVTSEAPGHPSVIKHSGFGYSSVNGQLTAETIEPAAGLLELQTAYTFDVFGNKESTTLDAITTSAGALQERQSFDSWGQRRADTWQPGTGASGSFFNRGFTGHEELDNLGLVHMNGRIYDPELGRFPSADPNIQSPGFLQSYNRYFYCVNNPLTLTDPS